MRKNNITLTSKNIISFFRSITSHFTGKEKIITLVSLIIMLSFSNITLCSSNIFNSSNASALSYQSNVELSFTFNPTLSVNISPSDLVISNLTPGTTSDSNAINVSVATNAAYGYTLSAIMNGDNSNLTHTNGANAFSSIATDASLSNLTTDNTWGYSYKNNLAPTPTWSSYSGLSNSADKVLFNTDSNSNGSIDFKIAAKASETQASGTYTGTINFTAVTKPKPINLADAYASAGKTMHNGYYVMQDMTSAICNSVEDVGAQLQVIDIRDDKVYWISKLADNHCWMTQNLDLDLDSNKTYTHWDTDLGWDDTDNLDVNATWRPMRSTIYFTGVNVPDWVDSNSEPYSAGSDSLIYIYTSDSDRNNDIVYQSLADCQTATNDDIGCSHSQMGKYYNYVAAVARNELSDSDKAASICPSGWRLPITSSNASTGEFYRLLSEYDIISRTNINGYNEDGFKKMRKAPLYFVRSGQLYNNYIGSYGILGKDGYYWSTTKINSSSAYNLYFRNNYDNPTFGINCNSSSSIAKGFSVRCLAR